VKLNFYACARYRKLSYASRDRVLNDREQKFVDEHAAICPECAQSVQQANDAFDMLRLEAFEAAPLANYDDRLLRKHKLQTVRASVSYWSPAMLGAGVAGLVVLAAMQMIAQSSHLPSFKVPASEARLSSPAIPSVERLNLNNSWQ
jgi:predicted anti-sigma-YlaC factor YlaD